VKAQLKIVSRLFLIGALGYSLIELLWRGFTHWSMSLTGGVCFTAIYYMDSRCRNRPLIQRGLMGSAVITGAEFLVGCVVNRLLHWDVWDYSQLRFNLLGQVCLRYSAYWFVLSMPLCWLSGKLRQRFALSPASRHLSNRLPSSYNYR
jgi:uncharacterized membrane protein